MPVKKLTLSSEEYKNLTQSPMVFLGLDFDGTLSPIVSTPDKARLPAQAKAILKKLTKLANTQLVVISGRELDDVMTRFQGIEGVWFSGNHGLQFDILGTRRDAPLPPGVFDALRSARKELRRTAEDIEGVIIEDKKVVLGVHYRLVKEAQEQNVKDLLLKIIKKYASAGSGLTFKEGKKVFELYPDVDWHKGKAYQAMLKVVPNTNYFPVFIGDDVTDENVFKVIKRKGLGIKVGDAKKTAAHVFVKEPKDVVTLLEKVYVARKKLS